jgi:hypothetical protein
MTYPEIFCAVAGCLVLVYICGFLWLKWKCPPTTACCDTCVHYVDGVCKRFPPTKYVCEIRMDEQITSITTSGFPKVEATMTCHEWTSK